MPYIRFDLVLNSSIIVAYFESSRFVRLLVQ